MTTPRDHSDRLREAVHQAYLDGQQLLVGGSGSKAFLLAGAVPDGAALLSVVEHSGVTDYRPDELVVTARAGTPLRELNRLLDNHRQMLPFEPPLFGGAGTIGGAVAAGLSGPGRPWRGAVRDCLLGVEMLNGFGELLSFGGQVMKNVAGYDVARLQAGAFGSLGVLLGVSIRLLPKPDAEQTCCFEMDAPSALARMRDWASRPLPLTGACFVDGVLYARLSGAEAAVRCAVAELGGDTLGADGEFWQQLRDHQLAPLAARPAPLRVSVPAAAAEPMAGALIEWAGALRWFAQTDAEIDCAAIAAQAEAAGGSAALFADGFARRDPATMAPALQSLHRSIKRAFDPRNVINPGLVEIHAD